MAGKALSGKVGDFQNGNMRHPTSPQQEHPNSSIYRNLQNDSDHLVGVSSMWFQILDVAPLEFGYKKVLAAFRSPQFSILFHIEIPA
jgi:hypothetical protein